MREDGRLAGEGSRDRHVDLAEEELRLLQLFAQGLPPDVVARRMGVSGRTLRRRVRGICDQSGSANLVQAVAWAARNGLL